MSTDAPTPATETDFTTPAAVVAALYACISFRAGGDPAIERCPSLFFKGGRIIPPKRAGAERVAIDVDTFLERFKKNLDALRVKGFREAGAAERAEVFGDVAHVFSTYECTTYPPEGAGEGPEPISRGMNSIQLIREGGRWWIASLAWDEERADNLLPQAQR